MIHFLCLSSLKHDSSCPTFYVYICYVIMYITVQSSVIFKRISMPTLLWLIVNNNYLYSIKIHSTSGYTFKLFSFRKFESKPMIILFLQPCFGRRSIHSNNKALKTQAQYIRFYLTQICYVERLWDGDHTYRCSVLLMDE